MEGIFPSSDEQEARVVPSRHTGTTVIDQMDTYGIPKENVVCTGQLPHGIGFDSDHRCIYADLDIESILGFNADQHKQRTGHRQLNVAKLFYRLKLNLFAVLFSYDINISLKRFIVISLLRQKYCKKKGRQSTQALWHPTPLCKEIALKWSGHRSVNWSRLAEAFYGTTH